jgi:hypothetical protein
MISYISLKKGTPKEEKHIKKSKYGVVRKYMAGIFKLM